MSVAGCPVLSGEGVLSSRAADLHCGVQVFMDSSMPIINYYDQRGKVRKINADRDPSEVYADVRPLVTALHSAAL